MDIRRGHNTRLFHRIFVVTAAVLLLLCLQTAPADTRYPDAFYRDKQNDNKTLVVFIAGLGGEKSWKQIAKLMDEDREFNQIDYLLYHSPKSLNFEDNVLRAQTIIENHRTDYQEAVYVGHSIGGIMIKRILLREASLSSDNHNLPEMVITFGTPIDTDKFTVSIFRSLGARIFWAQVPPLSREVFSIDRLREINTSWRTAVNQSPINGIKHVNIFGVQDKTAPVDNEGDSKSTVFINGDHLGIITPVTAEECSWIVFKTVLLARDRDPRKIDCVLKKPTANDVSSL